MLKIYRVFGENSELQVEQVKEEKNDAIKVIIRNERKTASILLSKEDWKAIRELTTEFGDFFK